MTEQTLKRTALFDRHVAAGARMDGKQVTVLEAADRLIARAVSPEMSEFYRAAHERRGTSVRLGARISRIVGDGTQVTGVELDGGEVVGLVLVVDGGVQGLDGGPAAGEVVDDTDRGIDLPLVVGVQGALGLVGGGPGKLIGVDAVAGHGAADGAVGQGLSDLPGLAVDVGGDDVPAAAQDGDGLLDAHGGLVVLADGFLNRCGYQVGLGAGEG